MENSKKNNLFEEQLRKIKYRADYKINETPRYRPLVDTNEVFDNVPGMTNEAGEQEDAPKPEGSVPPAPSNDQPMGIGDPQASPDAAGLPPAPETGEVPPPSGEGGELPPTDEPLVGDEGMGDMGADAPTDPGQQVDSIQNEIIKHNIAAMQSIHDQLEGLNSMVLGLNGRLDTLNADVEEVREPTNTEKLMSKKNVSYPYYFNLNDFWSGNWFNEQRGKENEKGIRELPDGSFIADFDDLPQSSKYDVQNSFNQFNETKKGRKIVK